MLVMRGATDREASSYTPPYPAPFDFLHITLCFIRCMFERCAQRRPGACVRDYIDGAYAIFCATLPVYAAPAADMQRYARR